MEASPKIGEKSAKEVQDEHKSPSPKVVLNIDIKEKSTVNHPHPHEHCHLHSTVEECIKHTLKGVAMGLIGFVLPVSLRYRKLTGWRKGAALGSLFGSFRALDCILWRIIGKLQNDGQSKTWLVKLLRRYHTGIAGGLAPIPVMLIDKPSILNSTMVFWLIVRALKSLVPSVPYGAVIVMCLSAGQILSTWVRAPDELSPSYLKFLYVQGGKSIPVMRQFLQVYPPITNCCEICHPGEGCVSHFIWFFIYGLKRALPVYIPIHLLSFYFSKRRSIPWTLANLLRSCSFLSLYCAGAWLSACMMFTLSPGVSRTKLFFCAWAAGLAVLLERDGRQKELAAYCMTHALDCAYNFLKKRRYVTPNDWVSTLAVIWACATVMQYHHYQPQFITRILFGIGMKKNSLVSPLAE